MSHNFNEYKALIENNADAQNGYNKFKKAISKSVESGNKLAIRYLILSTFGYKTLKKLMKKGYISQNRYFNMEVSYFIMKADIKRLSEIIKNKTPEKKVLDYVIRYIVPKGIPEISRRFIADYARKNYLNESRKQVNSRSLLDWSLVSRKFGG